MLDLIRPLQGTDSTYAFSTGNTNPLVGVPRGMTYWTPQNDDGPFLFNRGSGKLSGVRATHAPSPWMGDHGHFDVSAAVLGVGELAPRPTPGARASAVDPTAYEAGPDRFATRLLRDGIGLELTASSRCGVLRLRFPREAGDACCVVVQVGRVERTLLGPAAAGETVQLSEVRREGDRLVGVSRSHHGGVGPGFGCRFVVRVRGAAVLDGGVFTPDGSVAGTGVEHERPGGWLRLRPDRDRGVDAAVEVDIATSWIDHEQALLNLEQEVGGLDGVRGFEGVRAANRSAWSAWLKRFFNDRVLDAAGQPLAVDPVSASAAYRVGLFPMALHEPDASGRLRHRSPYARGGDPIRPGVGYTNNGFWDTHRTVYPLLGLVDPEGLREVTLGWLDAFRAGGWLPKWASPGYRDCMVGTHADAVLAEAVAALPEGSLPLDEVYAAVRRDAFEEGDSGGRWGRVGLAGYLERGWFGADEVSHSVCRTLDAAYNDACVGFIAERVGASADLRTLRSRARNYRHLWHAGSGFMRARNADGTWVEPFDPFAWSDGYIEGGPWQHSWSVPHDPAGFAELVGGPAVLRARLASITTLPVRCGIGRYPHEIHEMSEMLRARDRAGRSFGQYAHSNQPSHGILWLWAAVGGGAAAASEIRRVCDGLYDADTLPGDEDNGEMSAWYLLARMGRYRLFPGAGWVVLGETSASRHTAR